MAEKAGTYIFMSGLDCVPSIDGKVIGELQSFSWKYSYSRGHGTAKLVSAIGATVSRLNCANKMLMIVNTPAGSVDNVSYLVVKLGREKSSSCNIAMDSKSVLMVQRFRIENDVTYVRPNKELLELYNRSVNRDENAGERLRDYIRDIQLREVTLGNDCRIFNTLMSAPFTSFTMISWIDYLVCKYNLPTLG